MITRYLIKSKESKMRGYDIPHDVVFVINLLDKNRTEVHWFLHYKKKWYSDFVTVVDKFIGKVEKEVINVLLEQIKATREEVSKTNLPK